MLNIFHQMNRQTQCPTYFTQPTDKPNVKHISPNEQTDKPNAKHNSHKEKQTDKPHAKHNLVNGINIAYIWKSTP